MKCIHILLITVAIVFIAPGCNKWLDVKSKSQIVESDFFSNEKGFTDAMAGVYYAMASGKLYGDNLTMSFLEVLARRYDVFNYPTNSISTIKGYASPIDYTVFYSDVGGISFQSESVKSTLSDIWGNMYTAIANINNILKNIDTHKSVFLQNNYNLIKGEALGLRAFLHFDLIRMYGYSYVYAKDSANIPYVTQFSAKVITPSYSNEAILDSAIGDLNTAATLLKGDDINSSSDINDWLNTRVCHFNNLAVEATLARIYLYKGDKANALIHANNVINAGKLNFTTPQQLAINNATIDYSFSHEQVFALDKPDLTSSNQVGNYFINPTGASNLALSNDCGKVNNSVQAVENIYETTTIGGTDVRYLDGWVGYTDQSQISFFGFPTKFYQSHALVPGRVPLIRLPEMYYIAAECESAANGVAYLNKVREARAIPDLPTGLSNDIFQNEIFKEYQKEFYCEGQLFFYYKRLNAPNMLEYDDATLLPMNQKQYKFPLPDAEVQIVLTDGTVIYIRSH